jgi:hypothetical protein
LFFKKVLNEFVDLDSCSCLNKNRLRILVEIAMKENSVNGLTNSERKGVRVEGARLFENILSSDLQLLFLNSENRYTQNRSKCLSFSGMM